eukprot:403371070
MNLTQQSTDQFYDKFTNNTYQPIHLEEEHLLISSDDFIVIQSNTKFQTFQNASQFYCRDLTSYYLSCYIIDSTIYIRKPAVLSNKTYISFMIDGLINPLGLDELVLNVFIAKFYFIPVAKFQQTYKFQMQRNLYLTEVQLNQQSTTENALTLYEFILTGLDYSIQFILLEANYYLNCQDTQTNKSLTTASGQVRFDARSDATQQSNKIILNCKNPSKSAQFLRQSMNPKNTYLTTNIPGPFIHIYNYQDENYTTLLQRSYQPVIVSIGCQNQNCSKCDYINTDNCLKCDNPAQSYLTPYSSFNENGSVLSDSCYDICPVGTFKTQDNLCTDCFSNCNKCTTQRDCTQCKDGYLLLNDIYGNFKCQNECPIGMFNQQGKCTQCYDSCLQCSNSSKCAQCMEGYINQDGMCFKECIGQSKISIDGYCLDIIYYTQPDTIIAEVNTDAVNSKLEGFIYLPYFFIPSLLFLVLLIILVIDMVKCRKYKDIQIFLNLTLIVSDISFIVSTMMMIFYSFKFMVGEPTGFDMYGCQLSSIIITISQNWFLTIYWLRSTEQVNKGCIRARLILQSLQKAIKFKKNTQQPIIDEKSKDNSQNKTDKLNEIDNRLSFQHELSSSFEKILNQSDINISEIQLDYSSSINNEDQKQEQYENEVFAIEVVNNKQPDLIPNENKDELHLNLNQALPQNATNFHKFLMIIFGFLTMNSHRLLKSRLFKSKKLNINIILHNHVYKRMMIKLMIFNMIAPKLFILVLVFWLQMPNIEVIQYKAAVGEYLAITLINIVLTITVLMIDYEVINVQKINDKINKQANQEESKEDIKYEDTGDEVKDVVQSEGNVRRKDSVDIDLINAKIQSYDEHCVFNLQQKQIKQQRPSNLQGEYESQQQQPNNQDNQSIPQINQQQEVDYYMDFDQIQEEAQIHRANIHRSVMIYSNKDDEYQNQRFKTEI